MLAYDGTDYLGWQIQPRGPTVQGALLAAARGFDPHVRVVGASRTDAGVHALRQVASLTTRAPLSRDAVKGALNATLPTMLRAMWWR